MNCIICDKDAELILSLDSRLSVSSLGKALKAQGDVFLCPDCSHCQTIPSIDLFEYYSKEYKTLSSSFEEDDLYKIESGKPVFRNDHMAKTIIAKFEKINKINADAGAILDFGCGKSLVMKRLMTMSRKEDIYLYDVSDDYVRFWDSFIPKSQYSCFELPSEWHGFFSIVTSFFSLEHVPDPVAELGKIRRLLKDIGYIYIIVPNMYSTNISDMLVIDHIQHYSETSMKQLFSLCGFELVEADHKSHTQGSIYIAKLTPTVEKTAIDRVEVENTIKSCKNIVLFWKAVKDSIYKFENRMNEMGVDRYYIAGAGWLGTYISLQLQHPERLKGFIDYNQHKQKKGWQGKTVFSPGSIDWDEFSVVFSGLNLGQIKSVLPALLPPNIAETKIWTLANVFKADNAVDEELYTELVSLSTE